MATFSSLHRLSRSRSPPPGAQQRDCGWQEHRAGPGLECSAPTAARLRKWGFL